MIGAKQHYGVARWSHSVLCWLIVIATLPILISRSHADIGKLFFGASTDVVPPEGLFYVGFADTGEAGVYAITRQEQEPPQPPVIHMLSLGDEIDGYRVTDVTPEVIVLFKNGGLVRLALDAAPIRSDPMKGFGAEKPGGRLGLARRSTMAFESDVSIDSLRAIAQVAGVPDALLDRLQSAPIPARSRSGRPGWSLDPILPELIRLGLPFEPGDIVLGIDGRSVHDFEGLQRHLAMKPSSEVYRVEIQREGRLLMYEFNR